MRCKENGAWREISWKSLGEQVRATSRALLEAGVGEQEAVGIFSQNRPEWSNVEEKYKDIIESMYEESPPH